MDRRPAFLFVPAGAAAQPPAPQRRAAGRKPDLPIALSETVVLVTQTSEAQTGA